MSKISSYISDTHAMRAISYLSTALPELRGVEISRLYEAWGKALLYTLNAVDESPIGPEGRIYMEFTGEPYWKGGLSDRSDSKLIRKDSAKDG